ncbi:MAG: transporter [Stellaceae bacterium]
MAKTMRPPTAYAFREPLKIGDPTGTFGLADILNFMIKSRCKQTLTICAGLAIAIMDTAPSRAIDYQPFDFVPATPDTIMLMSYYEFATRDQFNNTITGTSKNSGLDSQIGIFRPLYYNQVFDYPYLLEFLLPFGAEYDGKINGTRLDDASGVSDPILSGTFWPISRPAPKTWFSISDWVSVPIGTYDKQRPLNLGNNRWQNDVQLDLTQGLHGPLEKFTFDVAADWIYYGNNPDAGTGHQTLSQDNTYNVYTWISYDISDMTRRAMPTLGNGSISVGYAGTFGGAQKLNGVRTGAKTEENQIRLTYEQFVAPTWQALLSLNHDVSVSGQFNQDFGLLFRLTKVF